MAYSHELPGYERLKIFNEFHRPLGIRYQLGCSLPGLHSPMVGLALARWTREFSGRDRDILEHLRPHIAVAYRNAEALGGFEQRSHALAALRTGTQDGLVRSASAGQRRAVLHRLPQLSDVSSQSFRGDHRQR